jgi:hypothetical protein
MMIRIRTALRRACEVLLHAHREQALMWDIFWQAGRAATPEAGPLTWAATLDGYWLGGSYLPGPLQASAPGGAEPA